MYRQLTESKVNPQVAPVSESTTDRVSTSSDTIHCSIPLNTPTHSPVSDQPDSGLYERSNPKPSNIEKCDGPERQKSVMCDTNLSQDIIYRIPVRLKGETENIVTTNDDFFTGVTKNLQLDIINILPLIEGVMVDYHTRKTNIIRDEVEGDIVVF